MKKYLTTNNVIITLALVAVVYGIYHYTKKPKTEIAEDKPEEIYPPQDLLTKPPVFLTAPNSRGEVLPHSIDRTGGL